MYEHQRASVREVRDVQRERIDNWRSGALVMSASLQQDIDDAERAQRADDAADLARVIARPYRHTSRN